MKHQTLYQPQSGVPVVERFVHTTGSLDKVSVDDAIILRTSSYEEIENHVI